MTNRNGPSGSAVVQSLRRLELTFCLNAEPQIPADGAAGQQSRSLFMPAIFEFPHSVSPDEIDGVGHVNNIEYLRWLQDAAIAHSTAQGWPSQSYHELGQGWVVRTHFIEYLIPAFADDRLVIRTWITDMKRVTSMRRYEILRPSDGKTLAVANTNWAFVNFATHQLCRIPAEITSAFEIVADTR